MNYHCWPASILIRNSISKLLICSVIRRKGRLNYSFITGFFLLELFNFKTDTCPPDQIYNLTTQPPMVSRITTICILLLSFILINCQQSDTSAPNDSGNIILRLTDAPFPHDKVSEVNVTITGIILDSESRTEPIDLLETPIQVNLLQLTNGVTVTLANSELPSGSYGLLKISLSDVKIVLSDKTVFDLNARENELGGTEIVLPTQFDIGPGLTKDLLLDFDVSRSFIPRMSPEANMGIAGFYFNPVIHLSDNASSGSLSGIVTSSVENKISRIHGATVSVTRADTLVTTTFTDRSGMYTILGLETGTYELKAEMNGYEVQIAKDIYVSASEQTKQSITLSLEF